MADDTKLPPEKAVNAAVAKTKVCAAERKAVEASLREGFKIGDPALDQLFFYEAVSKMEGMKPEELKRIAYMPNYVTADKKTFPELNTQARIWVVGNFVQDKCMSK